MIDQTVRAHISSFDDNVVECRNFILGEESGQAKLAPRAETTHDIYGVLCFIIRA